MKFKFFSGCAMSAVLASAISFSPAFGQNGVDALLHKSKRTCFERTYSGSHLSKHPGQTVSHISIVQYLHPENNNLSGQANIEIVVKFRNSAKKFSESGICDLKGNKLECGIECDGGGFNIVTRGEKNILLKTGQYGFRVLATGGCGDVERDEDIKYVSRKSDDKVFLLRPAPLNQCAIPKN